MRFTLFLLCILCSNLLFAQVPSWLKKSTSVGTFTTHSFHSSIYFDDHYYWSGDFWKDICFDEECIALPADASLANAFLLKTNTEGKAVDLWHFKSTNYLRIPLWGSCQNEPHENQLSFQSQF